MQGNFGYYWLPRAIVKVAVSHEPLFDSGTRWSYSNTNYVVLGLVIEAATSRALKAEIDARIIKPLRLRSTSFPTGRSITGPHAHGYVFTPKPLDVTTVSASHTWAAGNMVSTLELAAFYRALVQGKLLSPQLLQTMQTTVPALDATPALGKSVCLRLRAPPLPVPLRPDRLRPRRPDRGLPRLRLLEPERLPASGRPLQYGQPERPRPPRAALRHPHGLVRVRAPRRCAPRSASPSRAAPSPPSATRTDVGRCLLWQPVERIARSVELRQ